MASSRWQKQHIHFRSIVWISSALTSLLVIVLLLAIGFELEMAGVFFIVTFVAMRILLAFLLKNRYANSMLRIIKIEPQEIERDFRMLFKEKGIRFYRKLDEDTYAYEFPGHKLNMAVTPYWLSNDMNQPAVTKVTLHEINAQNKAFAETLAESIDESFAHVK